MESILGKVAKMSRHARSGKVGTVLIVDDFEDNRMMYAEFLRFSDYEVVEAADGVEAIEKAIAFLPDVVVMDLSLPLLDGCEATRRLKGDPRTQHIPILILTGHTLEGHSQEAHEAGCDGFLSKPCMPETLLETVRKVMSGEPLGASAGGHAGVAMPGGR